jgi:hypothetical protein
VSGNDNCQIHLVFLSAADPSGLTASTLNRALPA